MLHPHLLIKKMYVGRDSHFLSGIEWIFLFLWELVVTTAKQSSEKLHKVVLMDFITGHTQLFYRKHVDRLDQRLFLN